MPKVEKVEIYKSPNPKKKFKIVLIYDDNKTKTLHIGQSGADDFTKTGDEEAKQNYITRHKPRENWNDITTRGYWSRWLTWNKRTLKESVADISKRFKLKIDLKV